MKGKAHVTREKEREKSEEEEGLRGCGALHLLYAGPAGPVDDDGTAPRRDPVHHWRYTWAPSAGRGAPFRSGGRHG